MHGHVHPKKYDILFRTSFEETLQWIFLSIKITRNTIVDRRRRAVAIRLRINKDLMVLSLVLRWIAFDVQLIIFEYKYGNAESC